MEQYQLSQLIGDGAYGTVTRAVFLPTGETVAIKKMKKKFYSWDECLELREIKSLRRLTHPNLVKLREVIRVNDDLYLVFEYLERSMIQIIQSRGQPLDENQIRSYMKDTIQGLEYIHEQGIFHRDLKPDNLLISAKEECKIADFGQAREIRSRPPFTEYVSTRWYRAPELLLHSNIYSWQVDIFALGCIMSELYTMRPLFPGTNEMDQLGKLCSVLGTPSLQSWPEGYRLASDRNLSFPQYVATPLENLIPNASPAAVDFMKQCLTWDPRQRPNARQCLQHPFFTNQVIPRMVYHSSGAESSRAYYERPIPQYQMAPQMPIGGLSAPPPGSVMLHSPSQGLSLNNSLFRNSPSISNLHRQQNSQMPSRPFGTIGMGRHRFQ